MLLSQSLQVNSEQKRGAKALVFHSRLKMHEQNEQGCSPRSQGL